MAVPFTGFSSWGAGAVFSDTASVYLLRGASTASFRLSRLQFSSRVLRGSDAEEPHVILCVAATEPSGSGEYCAALCLSNKSLVLLHVDAQDCARRYVQCSLSRKAACCVFRGSHCIVADRSGCVDNVWDAAKVLAESGTGAAEPEAIPSVGLGEPLCGRATSLTSLAVSSCGAHLYVGDRDGVILSVERERQHIISDIWPGHSQYVKRLLSYGEDTVVSLGSDGIVLFRRGAPGLPFRSVLGTETVIDISMHGETLVALYAADDQKTRLAHASVERILQAEGPAVRFEDAFAVLPSTLPGATPENDGLFVHLVAAGSGVVTTSEGALCVFDLAGSMVPLRPDGAGFFVPANKDFYEGVRLILSHCHKILKR